MLTVTDNGVKIRLNSQAKVPSPMPEIIFTALALTILGLLISLHVISLWIFLVAIVVLLAIVWGRRWYRQRHAPQILSGGELFITPYTLSYKPLSDSGSPRDYQLLTTDNIVIDGQTLSIVDAKGHCRLQICGFSDPKQLTVAKAVLSGQAIKTQGKAVRMHSSDE